MKENLQKKQEDLSKAHAETSQKLSELSAHKLVLEGALQLVAQLLKECEPEEDSEEAQAV